MDFLSSEKGQALPEKLPHIIDGLMPASEAKVIEKSNRQYLSGTGLGVVCRPDPEQ